MRHRVGLAATALAVTAASLALPGRAEAVEPGFQVEITEAPRTVEAGEDARDLTVVVSTEERRCRKVRWSLLVQVDGPDLDELKVNRIEADGEFATSTQTQGDVARITDDDVDPGQLCRGRTVTANYRIAFDDGAASGRLLIQPQAFTADGTLLQEATAQIEVEGEEPEESPSPSPSPTASEPEEEESEEAAAPAEETTTPGDVDANAASANGAPPSLLGPGLVVGALLVFAGVGILLRLRSRNREAAVSAAAPPTGFYYPSR